ncbi:MAG: hypothetical protein RLZZ324_288 [Candidatus Parcubacteria bacterium]|jgi:hypothetical protein
MSVMQPASGHPRVLIAIPALNEERVIRRTVEALHSCAARSLGGYDVRIVIADNGSTDGTVAVANALASEHPDVRLIRATRRGKGLAIRTAWSSEDADIYAFMDADLATDLAALPALLDCVREGMDVAVGSRAHKDADVERTPFRAFLSRGYRAVLAAAVGTRIKDMPCGFKAASRAAVKAVMPQVTNDAWFFDSEFVLRAEAAGLRVREIPVRWRDGAKDGRVTRVRIRRIVREYLGEVWRMRRELGSLRTPGADDGFVWLVSVALMIATSVAPLFGALYGRALHMEWTGRQVFSPGDLSAYLSQISQAARGRFAFDDLATLAPQLAVPHPVWWLGGIISRVTGLGALASYHALRILLIPAGMFAFARAINWFVEGRALRRTCLLLLAFGGGMGALYSLGAAPLNLPGGLYGWPTDLWVSEANVFSSFSYSPHFIASWTLQILALFLVNRAMARRSLRDALLAGLAGAALLSFHPFYAVTIGAVVIAWTLLWSWRRGFAWRDVAVLAAFGLPMLPPAAYHAWLAFFTPNGGTMLGANLLWTPPVLFVFIGLAGFLALAPAGFLAMRRRTGEARARAEELAAWVCVNAALLYAPLTFQRRLMEGIEFPLAVLAGVALLALARKTLQGSAFAPGAAGMPTEKRSLPAAALRLTTMTFAGILLFLVTTIVTPLRDIAVYQTNRPAMFYRTPDQSAALSWIARETPENATFLSTLPSGNDIFGYAVRRTYVGHWALTPDEGAKSADVARFFSGMTLAERAAFVRTQGVTHVFFGPEERQYGLGIEKDPGFRRVFQSGQYAIFAVR